jgi:hypothetical protein
MAAQSAASIRDLPGLLFVLGMLVTDGINGL